MFEKNVLLKEYATLKVGGPAEFFVAVDSAEQLEKAVAEAGEEKIRVIGGGSNILVPDDGLAGVTIKNDLKGFAAEVDGQTVRVTVGAGEVFDEIVERCVQAGYWGLENLSHIPGSVGATPVQNVGAYGVEVADLIESVRVFDLQTKKFFDLNNQDCHFAYRDSIFKQAAGGDYVVCSVTFILSMLPKPNISYRDLAEKFSAAEPSLAEIREAVIAIRSKKFPDWNEVGTAGSFFKNPIVPQATYEKLLEQLPEIPGFRLENGDVKIPLGWVLDKACGLRGYQTGAVGTYGGQALVLVNQGGATASEIKNFANFVVETVFKKTGLKIEWEVTELE